MSQANLALFEADPASFLAHHLKSETKQQSMCWKNPSSPLAKKAKVVSSARKVMASVFWNAKGIVFIDYLQKGQTINGDYFANLLRQMWWVIKSNRHWKLMKRVLFHQDNNHAHKSVVAMAAVHGFELVDHPPYSPVGSSIRSMMRSYLQLRTFSRIRMRASIQELQNQWKKCVDHRVDYVKKINHIWSNLTIAS